MDQFSQKLKFKDRTTVNLMYFHQKDRILKKSWIFSTKQKMMKTAEKWFALSFLTFVENPYFFEKFLRTWVKLKPWWNWLNIQFSWSIVKDESDRRFTLIFYFINFSKLWRKFGSNLLSNCQNRSMLLNQNKNKLKFKKSAGSSKIKIYSSYEFKSRVLWILMKNCAL